MDCFGRPVTGDLVALHPDMRTKASLGLGGLGIVQQVEAAGEESHERSWDMHVHWFVGWCTVARILHHIE